jgi:hypothetical protein
MHPGLVGLFAGPRSVFQFPLLGIFPCIPTPFSASFADWRLSLT